jgi:hypothetical protein
MRGVPHVRSVVPGEATSRSEHLQEAAVLGARLADLIDDPEVFLTTLAAGLVTLADPSYRSLTELVSPDVSAVYAVRGSTKEAVMRPVRAALRRGSSASALWLAQRLAAADHRDLRLYALPCLRRSLSDDPEQSWQVMRRMGAVAGDWIEVDGLAEVWARGVLAERFRWAELEQLVYSPRPFERRLVGAVLATFPHVVPASGRSALRGEASGQALDLVAQLMGDAEVMVQKALSWAIREWTRVDPDAAATFLLAQTDLAVTNDDGARAWVIRDSLSHQPPELTASLRARLTGLRRDRRAPSTSVAATRSAQFAALIEAQEAVARQGDRYTRSQA